MGIELVAAFNQMKQDCAEFNLGVPAVAVEIVDDLTIRLSLDVLYHSSKTPRKYFIDMSTSDSNRISEVMIALYQTVSHSINMTCRLTVEEKAEFMSRSISATEDARLRQVKIYLPGFPHPVSYRGGSATDS